MINFNDLGLQSQNFINNIPYTSVYETSQGTYYKFTGYHANGKNIKEMTPKGYKCFKMMQVWSEIKHTTINVMMLKKL